MVDNFSKRPAGIPLRIRQSLQKQQLPTWSYVSLSTCIKWPICSLQQQQLVSWLASNPHLIGMSNNSISSWSGSFIPNGTRHMLYPSIDQFRITWTCLPISSCILTTFGDFRILDCDSFVTEQTWMTKNKLHAILFLTLQTILDTQKTNPITHFIWVLTHPYLSQQIVILIKWDSFTRYIYPEKMGQFH